MGIDEFSAVYLFEPLGIDSFDWWLRFESGIIEAASGLKLTSRDMAKIGILYLNNGIWNGEQILSEQWIEKCAGSYNNNKGIDVPGTDKKDVGYSYSWWTKTFTDSGESTKMFYGAGWGGQHIMVFPELDTVVVTTGGAYTSYTKIFELLEKHIVPALN